MEEKIFNAIRALSLTFSTNTDIQNVLKNKCSANDQQIKKFEHLYEETSKKEIFIKSIYAKEDEVWENACALITNFVQYEIKNFKDQLKKLTSDKNKKKEIELLFSDGDLSNFTPNKLVEIIRAIVDEDKQDKAIENIYEKSSFIYATKSASKIKEIYQISALIYEKASNKLSETDTSKKNFEPTDLTYENILKNNEKVIDDLAKHYKIPIGDLQDKKGDKEEDKEENKEEEEEDKKEEDKKEEEDIKEKSSKPKQGKHKYKYVKKKSNKKGDKEEGSSKTRNNRGNKKSSEKGVKKDDDDEEKKEDDDEGKKDDDEEKKDDDDDEKKVDDDEEKKDDDDDEKKVDDDEEKKDDDEENKKEGGKTRTKYEQKSSSQNKRSSRK